MIVGLTPNLAARVEAAAPGGEVAISDATAESCADTSSSSRSATRR